ncbi:MAG: C39 family peptidase [Christensenellales bacterium]
MSARLSLLFERRCTELTRHVKTPIILLLTVALLFFSCTPASAAAAGPLAVPFLKQVMIVNGEQNWNQNCGQTSCVMVEAYHKGITPLNSRIVEVNTNVTGYKDGNPQLGVATDVNDWVKTLNWMGIANCVDYDGSIEEIKGYLDKGQPIIGHFLGRYTAVTADYPDHVKPSSGHAMVIVGYNDANGGTLTVSDPGSGGNYYRSFSYDIINNKLRPAGSRWMVVALGKSSDQPVTPVPATPTPAPPPLSASVSDIGLFTSTVNDPYEKGFYFTASASGGIPPYQFDGIVYINDIHMGGFQSVEEGRVSLSFGVDMPSGTYRLDLMATDNRGTQAKVSQTLFYVPPTPVPTIEPTPEPTPEPTVEPTPEPTVEPTLSPEPDLLSANVYDLGFFVGTVTNPDQEGLYFSFSALGGVPPYRCDAAVYINDVQLGSLQNLPAEEISVSVEPHLEEGNYRVELKVTDNVGTQAFASHTVLLSYEGSARPGDADLSGVIDLQDLVALIDYLVAGKAPVSLENANADGQGDVSIQDLVWIIDKIIGS